jgi:hypothetical protein
VTWHKQIPVEVGTRVAVVSENGMRQSVVTFTRVERITKTLIMLENGDRFRRSDQQRPGDYSWAMRPYLADPESEEVRRIAREQKARDLLASIRHAVEKFPDQPAEQAQVAERIVAWATQLRDLVAQAAEVTP